MSGVIHLNVLFMEKNILYIDSLSNIKHKKA